MSHRLDIAADVRAWLNELRVSDPAKARVAGEAVTALLDQGSRLGPPLVMAVESALRAQDPKDALDSSYQHQLELLARVRRGVADVATSRKRLELNIGQLETQGQKLEAQRGKAAEAGRDDLAQEARARQSGVQHQLRDLRQQYAGLQNEEEQLTIASQRLQAKVDAFRTGKETIAAAYTAGQARRTVSQALAELGEDDRGDRPDDVGDAIAAARAAAEELLDSTSEIEQDARQLAGEGWQGREPMPPLLKELRAGAPAGRDMRILFAITPPGTVVLLAARQGHTGWRDWYRGAFPLARNLLSRWEVSSHSFASFGKDEFLHEFFPSHAPELEAGAARLIARNRVHPLLDIRRQAGLTQAQMAERMGVSEERVTAIEDGEPTATAIGILAAYVEALGGQLEIIVDLGAEQVILG